MKNTNTSQLLLPNEIVYDILLSLPVKSLFRFKLLSKPWGSLISEPNFAESHLSRANTKISQGERNANPLRFGQIISEQMKRHRNCLSLYSMDSDGSNREVAMLDCGSDYVFDAMILGSCNGLLLVAVGREKYFLWNPSIGKYKRISPCHLNEEAMVISGLGYESTSRNYKGIIVSHYISGPSSPHRVYDTMQYDCILYRIYDYKLNSWSMKEHGEFRYRLCKSDSATMVNGVPHWSVYRRRPSRLLMDGEYDYSLPIEFDVTYVIIYVDLETEKVKEVELPELAATGGICFNLGVLEGCLCVSLYAEGGSETEVWAMKEYGIPTSWSKLFVIPSSFNQLWPRPKCFTGKNEVLMEVHEEKTCGRKLIIFNLDDQTEKILSLYWYGFIVCTYVGSLVFPEEPENEASQQGIN